MNQDLIKQLESLSPTEGEWDITSAFKISNYKFTIAETYDSRDTVLIKLAPTMRLEILAMAKEIEELKNFIRLKCITPPNPNK